MAQSSPPDWVVISGAIVTVLGALGGGIAWMNGAFRQRGSDQHERQMALNKDATSNAAAVLDSALKLLNEIQEELDRKAKQLEACEALVTTLKAEISDLKERLYKLQFDLRNQRGRTRPTDEESPSTT